MLVKKLACPSIALYALLFCGCESLAPEPAHPRQGTIHWEVASDFAEQARSITIYRDEWGVPHVYGPTDASVVFGATYARAEDEFHYMEQAIIKMLGKAASISGEEWLAWDIFLRKLEIEKHSQQEYLSAPKNIQRLCEAFCRRNEFLSIESSRDYAAAHHTFRALARPGRLSPVPCVRHRRQNAAPDRRA